MVLRGDLHPYGLRTYRHPELSVSTGADESRSHVAYMPTMLTTCGREPFAVHKCMLISY